MKKQQKKMVITFAKFATTSVLATVVDMSLFLMFFSHFLPVFWAEFFSGFIGMIINFVLQKKYVFQLERNALWAFVLSIGFSLIALVLGSFLMRGLTSVDLFYTYLIIPKIIVVGFKFVFNFITKKWIFEKSFKGK